MSDAPLREDVLVSVGLSALPATDRAFDAVRALAAAVDARFRFREVVLVVEADDHTRYLPLVRTVPHLRLLAVQPGIGHYRRRVIAAEEAIGDVVLLADVDEVADLDVVAMIERAASDGHAIVASRPTAPRAMTGLWAPVVALGRAAGFRVSARDTQTVALPRTLLNQLASHSDPELALRFLPRDPRIPVAFLQTTGPGAGRHRGTALRRRLALVHKLAVYMAPALLLFVTLASLALALLGVAYAVYILGAWFVVDDLAPGWLTTSVMLSLTATFLGLSILGLSLGVQQLLSHHRRDGLDSVAHEINRIDLFGDVAAELNVDVDRGAPPGPAD